MEDDDRSLPMNNELMLSPTVHPIQYWNSLSLSPLQDRLE